MELKFIHITKCAGTFIEDIGEKNNICWGRFHKDYGFWHDLFPAKPDILKQKYDWFVIVRNPYDRILSEYYCRWSGIGQKHMIHTKEQFNKYLIEKINLRSETGHHYTEQYKYIDTDENIKINIIKFENLNDELTELFQKYHINIDPKKYDKINAKENHNTQIKFTVNDFDEELIKLINEVYHTDFATFNYEKSEKTML